MNGVQTRFKCKLDVKRCKRFVFPPSSLLPRSNALKTKAIRYFQTDRTLTRIVSPPLNNAVGDIVIGDYCRIGLGNTVIGPIQIDNGVNISQNVALIGLDHNYQNITQGIIEQGITTSPIHIGEHTIIGANVIVLPGITIGKHCFIGAGCVVTQNIPDYCVTVGNPARIIKRYNPQSQTWEKI